MQTSLRLHSFILFGLLAACGEEDNAGSRTPGSATTESVAADTTPLAFSAPDSLPTAPPQFVSEPVNAQQQVPQEEPAGGGDTPSVPVTTTPSASTKSTAPAATGAPSGTAKPAASGTAAMGSAAASGSAAGSAGAPADCSKALLCDDFETTAPGATGSPWKITQGAGYTVEVQSTQVHSGTKAVHIKASSATGNGYLLSTKGFPATDFWGRVWIRVTSAAGGHQCLMALNAKSDQVRLLNEMGAGELATNLKSSDKINGKNKMPQDKWFCFEWHQSPTELHVYTDGTEATDATAKWSVASIDSLQFGLVRFQAGKGNADLYYDDVVVNTERVGCN